MRHNPHHLSPFAHELDRYGDNCAHDCPACQWAGESRRVTSELSRFQEILMRYKDCELFQIGLRELGLA
jgi:hypothetical protein